MHTRILWIMKQDQVIDMYARGFTQSAIAEYLGVHQSTVSRYLTNPNRKEEENFYENYAYGVYTTKSGERVLFNRRYKPLSDKKRIVKDIEKTEWFYNDGTWWNERFHNSKNEIVIYGK